MEEEGRRDGFFLAKKFRLQLIRNVNSLPWCGPPELRHFFSFSNVIVSLNEKNYIFNGEFPFGG